MTEVARRVRVNLEWKVMTEVNVWGDTLKERRKWLYRFHEWVVKWFLGWVWRKIHRELIELGVMIIGGKGTRIRARFSRSDNGDRITTIPIHSEFVNLFKNGEKRSQKVVVDVECRTVLEVEIEGNTIKEQEEYCDALYWMLYDDVFFAWEQKIHNVWEKYGVDVGSNKDWGVRVGFRRVNNGARINTFGGADRWEEVCTRYFEWPIEHDDWPGADKDEVEGPDNKGWFEIKEKRIYNYDA